MKWLVGIALLASLTGCSRGADKKQDLSQANGVTTSSSTITTVAASPTTTQPPMESRVERVLANLLQRRNEVFAAPDPARVDEYLTPHCSCYADERNSLTTLRDKGWHWATPMFEVLGVRVADRRQPDLVTLTAVVSRPPERVVDQAGNLATPQGPGLEPTGYSFLLSRETGTWKIADTFGLRLAPETIRQIIAEGVPS
ncbi:MAG: hypothetical protein AB1679_18860 [Actinomycetota bacterium]